MLSDSFVKKEILAEDELEHQRREALLAEMGLTRADTEKLRRTMLSPDEAVCAKREELDRVRGRRGRKDDWEEFVDAKRRMGRVLHYSDFLRGLRRVNPAIVAAPAPQPSRLGLYVVRNTPAEEIPGYRGTWRWVPCPFYVGYLDQGWLPEYEIDLVNDVGVPVGQRRGWRTLLLRLILRRDDRGRRLEAVTERQALAEFGPPTQGATASAYRRQLWEFRNGRGC